MVKLTPLEFLAAALVVGLGLIGAGVLAYLGWYLIAGSRLGGMLDARRRQHQAAHTAAAIADRNRLDDAAREWRRLASLDLSTAPPAPLSDSTAELVPINAY